MAGSIYPKDFFQRRAKMDAHLCFVLTPSKVAYDDIRKAVDEIAAPCGFSPVHASAIRRPGTIHTDIWDHMQRAAVVIADVSEHNPNVYFELGVAMAVKDESRLIILRNAASSEPIPFDLSIFRFIPYTLGSKEGLSKLTDDLAAFLKTISGEDDFIKKMIEGMREWESADYEYDRLPQISDLKILRRRLSEEDLDTRVRAYALAASMYYSSDCKFWTDLNKENGMVVGPLSALMCGRYVRPAYRSAYALQYMSEGIRRDALDTVKRRMGNKDIASRLADAVMQMAVQKFVEEEVGKYIPVDEGLRLIAEFKRWDVA